MKYYILTFLLLSISAKTTGQQRDFRIEQFRLGLLQKGLETIQWQISFAKQKHGKNTHHPEIQELEKRKTTFEKELGIEKQQ